MNLENIQSNQSGIILRFALPSIAAMLLTSLISVADGFFIGNFVGKEGIAAVNLGLPIVYLYLAIGLMVSVGGVAIAGMALGGEDRSKCNNVFNQTISTVTAVSILLSAVMWFCLNPMLSFLHADAQVAVFFRDYYGIMLLELPVMVINTSLGMFIRSEGRPQYFMQVNIVNVLLNILLNYLFVRRLGFGVKGIAFASLLSAVVTLVCLLHFFVKKAQIYKLWRFVYSGEVMRNTLLNGSSEFVGEMSLSISMFAYNYVILKNIGVDGVTAFTIVSYVAYIFSMIVIGFGQGASPLISFTFGAGEGLLAARLHRITCRMVLLAGGLVFGMVLVGAGWYSGFFVKSEAVADLVRPGMAIFGLSFLFSGMNVITSFYFTSIGRALESAVISSARGLVFLLAGISLFPLLFGMAGVWLVAPVTECLTVFLSLLFLYRDKFTRINLQG